MPKQHEELGGLFEETWDKKKIAMGIGTAVLVLGGLFFAKNYFLPSIAVNKAVEGAQTQIMTTTTPGVSQDTPQKITLPSVSSIGQQIHAIQQQVTNLNVNQLASSSPQIQQIIQEIQSLPQVPGNVAKQACIQLCNKL